MHALCKGMLPPPSRAVPVAQHARSPASIPASACSHGRLVAGGAWPWLGGRDGGSLAADRAHRHALLHACMLAVIKLEATSWTAVACCCFCVSRGLCVHAVSKRGEAKDKPAARLEKHFS